MELAEVWSQGPRAAWFAGTRELKKSQHNTAELEFYQFA